MGAAAYNRGSKAIREQFDREASGRPKAPLPCPCSCGETTPHVVARKKAFDDVSVQFWSDGCVTVGLNTIVVRASRGAKLEAAVAANWEVAGKVCLFAHTEIRALVLRTRDRLARSC
jgi:hypothetical protein